MKILIIEDDQDQAHLYKKALERMPAVSEVCVCWSGQEALLEEWPRYGVVIVDLFMPHMSGDQCIAEAYERWGKNLPPVLLFTASPMSLIHKLSLPMPPTPIYQKSGGPHTTLETLREAVYDALERGPGA